MRSVPIDTYLSFGNGKKRPDDEGAGKYVVFGSNGIIGHCDEFNNGEGTTIIGRVGSYCGSVQYSKEKCWVTDNAIKVQTKSGADSRYFYYLLLNTDLHALRGGSGQPLINQTSLKSLEVTEREITDQKAIAHILGTLDDKIELNQKMNETLEEIAKAIFKSWFVDFDPVRAKMEGRATGLPDDISDLFPDELVDSEIGEIPKGWETSNLGASFSIQYGKNLPTKNLIKDGYPVFDGNGVIGFHSKYLYEDVMTLIACRGAASGKVARTLPKSFVTNNSLVVDHSDSKVTSQRYIEFFLENGNPENYVTGSAQPQLTIDNIKNFPFMTPAVSVLDAFQDVADTIAKRQVVLGEESKTLSELRDTLLPKLISGELQIPDAEKFLDEAGI